MRLRLELPPDAVERVDDAGGVLVELPAEPWLHISIAPLITAPLDRAAWLRALLVSPRPLTTRVLGSTSGTTTHGWPLETINLIDLDLDRERVVQHRLITTYDVFGHVGAVSLSSADDRRFHDRFRSQLLPMCAGAWPDWRSRSPVALAELWSLDRTR